MRRAVPPVLVLFTILAAAPPGAGAQTVAVTPAAGRATLVATEGGTILRATFLSGRKVAVTATYRRRSSSSSVRLAGRFAIGGKRCPARPSSADRRRLKRTTAISRTTFVATGSARFRGGLNRSCVWAKEGGGGWRRPTTITERFSPTLFAATAVEGSQDGLAVTGYDANSSLPLVGTLTQDVLRTPCGTETRPVTSRLVGSVHTSSVSSATGSDCTRFALQLTSGRRSASLAAGPAATTAPARVVQHVGDCNPDAAQTVRVPAAAAKAFIAAAGCRLGRLIPGRSENRAQRSATPSGNVYGAVYRGWSVVLAPRDTTIDLLVDTRP